MKSLREITTHNPLWVAFIVLIVFIAVVVVVVGTVLSVVVGIVTSLLASMIFYGISCTALKSQVVRDVGGLGAMRGRLKTLSELTSQLSHDRKMEILAGLRDYYPKLRAKRRMHMRQVKKAQRDLTRKGVSVFSEPAWYSISTTPSDAKCRLTVGFANKGCAYWRQNPERIGCLHCGYGSGAIQEGEPSKHELIRQFDKVLNWAIQRNFTWDVVEFLNDGSFLNYKGEWPEGFATSLFHRLAAREEVKRVLIETRPKYVTEEKIRALLSQLRDEQWLEIGIGIETPDDFIRQACINKGYNVEDFEDAVKIIAGFAQRCSVVVYTLVKPAFLTEREAIEDVVGTVQYLSNVSKRYNIDVVPKLEPAVMARGTLLDVLHFDVPPTCTEWYRPLSYWSVVEIIARTHLLGLATNIRVGAREDMDVIEKVPAIYNHDGTFNQYDFWVYDAVQQFSANHDFARLLADLQVVQESGLSLFDNWKRDAGIGESATAECMKRMEAEIDKVRGGANQKTREQFLKEVFDVLDAIELHRESHEFARRLQEQKKMDSERKKSEIEEFVNDKFEPQISEVYAEVRRFFFERDDRQMLRIYVQLRHLVQRTCHDIWIGIPTRS